MEQCKTAGPAIGAALRGPCVEEPKIEPQICAQIGLLHDAVQFLDEQVSRLEVRLLQVTMSEPPFDPSEKQGSPCLVPMAEEIYCHRTMVNRANDRIGSLLDRLEL